MEQKTSSFDRVLGAWDILVIAFGAIEEVELEENAYDIIYLNGSSSYMED